MPDYMKTGNSHDDTDAIEKSPFKRIYWIPPNKDDQNVTAALEGAEKIRNTVLNRGEIQTDEAVENACPVATTSMAKDWAYYRRAGPLAATADDIVWRTAYTLADNAPEPNSEQFKEEASELAIPEHAEHAPKLVLDFYRYLHDKHDTDGRPVHPEELKGEAASVLALDNVYDRAFRFLDQLPWVESPARSGPAWSEATEEADATEEVATHG